MSKLPQRSITYRVFKTIKDNNLIRSGEKIVVALSGGADSTCLFYILLELRQKIGFELSACHFNHRLRAEESERDAEFVKKICTDSSIKLIYDQATKNNSYKNEKEAREARYNFFQKILDQGRGDKIAIGHTANDNAETILFRLMRGTGFTGLRSIPLQRKKFIRPLLHLQRDRVIDYLKVNNLRYVIDSSNLNTKYSRNFIRHKILPLFVQANPNFVSSLAESSILIDKEYQLIESHLEKIYGKIVDQHKNNQIILNYKRWQALPYPDAYLIIRYVISKLAPTDNISQKQIDQVYSLLQKGIGRKYKVLVHSLRVELVSAKIIIAIK